MKNYGLQVKEIPIIFRGEAPIASVPHLLFNDVVEKYIDLETGAEEYIFIAAGDVRNLDKISIELDGVLYTDVPRRTSLEGLVYFGYNPHDGGVEHDYIFSIHGFDYNDSENLTQAYLNVDLDPVPDTIELKMWDADPNSESDGKKIFAADLTGNGQINHFRARFACGENGTLHLRPYVILNGNIRVNLCNFAQGGDQYIAGDNEEVEFDCYVPIETHAVAYVEAENTGEYPSLVDAAMTVQYEDFIEAESIVGYEGINLRRR